MVFTKEQKDKFAAMYNQLVHAEGVKITQAVDSILELLVEGGGATNKYIGVKSLVPHLASRSVL